MFEAIGSVASNPSSIAVQWQYMQNAHWLAGFPKLAFLLSGMAERYYLHSRIPDAASRNPFQEEASSADNLGHRAQDAGKYRGHPAVDEAEP